jgi:RND family efflux transporter MFP subunit
MSLRNRFRHLLPPLAILAVGGAVLAALILSRPQPPAPSGGERGWVVEAREVRPGPLSPTLTLYGRLESPRDATLSAAVTADVEAVPAAEGRTVEEGAVVVRLDRRDLAATLAQREADLAEARVAHEANRQALERQKTLVELAERGVQRAERLADQSVGSQAELDAARQALEQARLALIQARQRVDSFPARLKRLQAQVDQAERDLARTRITAPFPGRIMGVEVAPGDRVRPGEPLVSLYDPAHLEVRATIPAPDVATVREAMAGGEPPTAVVSVDGRRLRAVLDRLGGRSPQGGAGVEGLFRVAGEAPADLPLGRFAELTVELPPVAEAVAVPFSALYGRDRIYVVRDGRMRAIQVERVGQRAEPDGPSMALVRAPELRAGDRVVTTQLPRAMDGLKVRTAGDGAEPAR